MVAFVLPQMGFAVQAQPASPAVAGEAQPLSAKTDQELNLLLSNFDALDEAERNALIDEVKFRMIRSKARGGTVKIRTERRFGRLIRRPDGKVVRIEGKVVQVRPVPTDKADQGRYGLGFEQRHAERNDPPSETAAPVVKVKDPSR